MKPQITKETDNEDWGQCFLKYQVLHQEKTAEQELLLIETESFGRVLLLDGAVQLTEQDNFIYHELLVHVPLFAHELPKNVLIIGGGDGGSARHALMHPEVSVTLVEIDTAVIDFSQQFLPFVCGDVFEHENLSLVIDDGAAFVANTTNSYDVIIVDSTDPVGPGAVLFTKEFYAHCKQHLNDGGILVTQNGIPFTQPTVLTSSMRHFNDLFVKNTCYIGTVPTYLGGPMAFGFASDDESVFTIDETALSERMTKRGIYTNYYTPSVHKAAFTLPKYIEDVVVT